MKTINLNADWTYRTPVVTIDYAAGAHEVEDDIAAAAKAAGVTGKSKDKANGDEGTATAGAAGDTGEAQG